MRAIRGAIPVLLVGCILLSACSSKATEEVSDRVQEDIRCANYKLEREEHPIVDGLPTVNGISANRATENCKLEIVAMYDPYPEDYPKSLKPTKPNLVGVPQEITNRMKVRRWIKVEVEKPKTNQYLVVPAYTFQCWINEDNDATFSCKYLGEAAHKLSTYTEQAFDISGAGVVPLDVVNLTFAGGYGTSEKETYVREHGLSIEGKLTKESPSVWTLLLVLHQEWERTGVAEVCFEGLNTYHCDLVRARAIHLEDFVLDRGTQEWKIQVNSFREIIHQPNLQLAVEPFLPSTSLHRNYPNGPQRQTLGGPVTALTAAWKNAESSLKRENLEASIEILLKLGISLERGKESEGVSVATVSYVLDPQKAAPGPRCFEVLSVGGTILDKPVTGMVLREGCSR